MPAATIVCSACGFEKPKKEFERNRVKCQACRITANQKRISSSYESYLRNLYSKSKNSNKRDPRAVGRDWHITYEDLVAKWEAQGGRCALSGVYLTHHVDGSGVKDHNASIDRISQEVGYTPSNTQLVCYRINIMKHNLPEDMFFWWIKTIANFTCD
jgi:transcription initiation factor TFIIIB Brf1 subunit/transcription initiation factor TFIIB